MQISPRIAKFRGFLMIPLLTLLGPALAADTTAADQAGELAQAAPAAPSRFLPSEKIKADTVVDFPVDI